MSDTSWIIAIVGAYLCGSIPFGLLIGWAKGVDIREHGSRNIGATNCGRVLGRPWGKVCFVLDFIKGCAPVAIAGACAGLIGSAGSMTAESSGWWIGVVAGAVCGHVFPLWLRFKGGKGVATAFGALVGVFPVLSLTAAAGAMVWFVVAAASGFVSLASIAATLVMILFSIAVAEAFGLDLDRSWPLAAGVAALAILVLVRHRGNLKRVLAGAENRIGGRKTPQNP